MDTRQILFQGLLLLLSILEFADCSGHFNIRLKKYVNPGGKGSNGNCCDGVKWICRGRCDHYFTLCLDYAQGSDDIDSCPLGRFTTDVTPNMNIITFGSTIGDDPNPRSIHFPSWRAGQRGLKVKVDVWDSDDNRNDFVESLVKVVTNMMPGKSIDNPYHDNLQIVGRTSLGMEIYAYCDSQWYGPECSVYCEVLPGSHYDCNDNGEKICHPGWTGAECQYEVNECSSSPCHSPGGACIDLVNGFRCECDPGYTGALCETDIDECEEIVCANNGACVNEPGTFHCLCHSGFIGPYCEIEEDECLSTPCMNNGTCQDGVDYFTCLCEEGYTGGRCEEDIDDCFNHSCQNGAVCVDQVNGFYCMCADGYEGEHCQDSVDDCQHDSCQHGGTCHDGHNGYTCECQTGWQGDNCQQNVNECENNICLNSATCLDKEGTYECMCQSGWTGVHCETNIDECVILEMPCNVSHLCVDKEGSYDCVCPDGYHGDHCDIIDYCYSNPCKNNGTCISADESFSCICPDGYSGETCSVLSKSCPLSFVCENGGVCQEEKDSYFCECKAGFFGDKCEVHIMDCSLDICKNGGRCIEKDNDFICMCAPGFVGTYCEDYVESCQNTSCRNNGTCSLKRESYQCECVDGYSGTLCEIYIGDVKTDPKKIDFSNTEPGELIEFTLKGYVGEKEMLMIKSVLIDELKKLEAKSDDIVVKSEYFLCETSMDRKPSTLAVFQLSVNGAPLNKETSQKLKSVVEDHIQKTKTTISFEETECDMSALESKQTVDKPSFRDHWYYVIAGIGLLIVLVVIIIVVVRRKYHRKHSINEGENDKNEADTNTESEDNTLQYNPRCFVNVLYESNFNPTTPLQQEQNETER